MAAKIDDIGGGRMSPSSVKDHVVRLYDIVGSVAAEVRELATRSHEERAELNRKFDALMDRFQRKERTNWPLLATFMGVFVAMAAIGVTLLIAALGGFWMVLTLKMDNQIHPLSDNQAQIRADVGALKNDFVQDHVDVQRHNQENTKSTAERSENSAALRSLQGLYGDMNSRLGREISTRVANEGEIETQFKWAGQEINTQWAQAQRENWRRDWALYEMGARYPQPAPAPFFTPSYERGHDGAVDHALQ